MAEIAITIYSNPIFIPPLLSFLDSFLKTEDIEKEERKKIAIATEEAVTNIIKHSYENKKDKIIIVEIKFNKDLLSITLKHKGKSFSLDNNNIKVNINKILKEKKKGGFGLFIIKNFVDELEIGEKEGWKFYLLKKKLK